MTRPDRLFDWTAAGGRPVDRPTASTARRTWVLLALFLSGCVLVLARAVQLELSLGEDFRAAVRQSTTETVETTPARGRILARDNTVLAEEREVIGLAVHYRYLQSPLDATWLSKAARRRLPRSKRRDSQLVREQEGALQFEIQDLHARLAALCRMAPSNWRARLVTIDERVARTAKRVNQRRLEQHARAAVAERLQTADDTGASPAQTSIELASHLFAAPADPVKPVTTREQETYHLVLPEIEPQVADEIAQHAGQYPGAKLVRHRLRCYPLGNSAAQLIGYLTSEAATAVEETSEPVHQFSTRSTAGIELSADKQLRPVTGIEKRTLSRDGQLLTIQTEHEPRAGRDVRLSIDPSLQLWAEQLLDRHTRQRKVAVGGSVVVMDVQTGELLVAASSPRFDPNTFSQGNSPAIANLLARAGAPMIDRCSQMALPPGSVFKPLVAIALLESGRLDPSARFTCQGFLESEDAWRCALFRRQGIGHGDIDLARALAQSCNVYFYHHATQLGAPAILDWARRFGFGEPSGSEISGELGGNLPSVDPSFEAAQATNLARGISIGQHEITVTPLQITRMMAAIGNGGRLIKPRLILGDEQENSHSTDVGQSIGVHPSTLRAVRAGLLQSVNDQDGTAHDVRLPHIAIAGKTGTAQSGPTRPDHAWFAGYVPADQPRFAFCVALEHGEDAAHAAGIARQIVQRMIAVGHLAAQSSTAARVAQPDKQAR